MIGAAGGDDGTGALVAGALLLYVLVFVVLFCGLGGVVGYYIGKSKGQARTGFWLGACLGAIGWLIVALFVRPSPEAEAHRMAKIAAYRQAIHVAPGAGFAPYSVDAQQRLGAGTTGPLSWPTAGRPPVWPAAPTPTRVPGLAAGWHPDPYARFAFRYFNGTVWTSHTSTDGAQFHDPIGL